VPAVAVINKVNCTCNMPLCICVAPAAPVGPAAQEHKTQTANTNSTATNTSTSTASTVKKPVVQSSFSGFGLSSLSSSSLIDRNGDLDEQCREAVKNNQLSTVKQLLELGARSNYIDRTGNSLLHIAAMFNHSSIVELLLSKGAEINVKNSSNESPIDLAPAALQFKMKQFKQ
jgi:hypothetical protein